MNNVNVTLGHSKETNRVHFRKTVGTRVYNVVRDTMNGSTTAVIAKRYRVPKTTVAAIRANLTRGSYEPFASFNPSTGTVHGLCQFGG